MRVDHPVYPKTINAHMRVSCVSWINNQLKQITVKAATGHKKVDYTQIHHVTSFMEYPEQRFL